jgi:glucose/arabinose dehydrogenase
MDDQPYLSRRAYVAAFGTAVGASLAGCEAPTPQTSGTHSPIRDSGPAVSLTTVATGFQQPIAVEDVPGTDARFIADKFGTVSVQDGEELVETPVLDVSGNIVEREDWETGLIGFALHPEFADNRRFYVRYSATPREGTPESYNHTAVLEEYRATADLRNIVDGSRRVVLEVPEPGKWHNAGDIVFGPEGYLYVALGDGGSDIDDTGMGHVDDWYDAVPGGNGQDITENLLGSILRIDVDGENGEKNYAIPPDNPLVGEEGLDELYAWGFRNPWRMEFHDGDLFAVDVGNDSYEEVNRVENGGNYGWNVREGFACHKAGVCPEETPDGDPLIDPVVAYPHDRNGREFGSAIVGGRFCDDPSIPALEGNYVFADLRGKLFVSQPPPDDRRPWSMTVLDADLENAPLSIESAADGGVYVLTTDFDGNGAVHRMTAT